LQKENKILKSELENKFDKEKHIMQAQLQDALRDKSRLEEGKQEMEEKVGRLQKRLEELSV
jgi:predicted nuclease with TOPRIM domain